jgi:mannose/cellobiose epimerase-like protein (N-acyl-D-glucosamine 2-epimerase family)
MDIISRSDKLIKSTIEFILARSDWLIDTKVNIITGQDFTGEPEPFKQADIIYSWIQGRGLEALVGHARYYADEPELSARIKKLTLNTLGCMEAIRSQNNGRMFFSFNQMGEPSGKILPQSNYSDLFYSKGLLCAASYYDLNDIKQDAEAYFKRTIEDIGNDCFLSDQQAFDPKNPVHPVPGKFLQGPRMIALGGLASAFDITGDFVYLRKAHEFIAHILKYHVNKSGDFWEAVDKDLQPWLDDGKLLSDPGHALEFVGLSLKCLMRMLDCGDSQLADYAASCRAFYPELMKRSFANGFNQQAGGICKAFDLISCQTINSDMPWWSLPETMRAAAFMLKFCGEDQQISEILSLCSEAFFANYVNPNAGNLQYQTRAADGSVVDAIPAVPDADPGYHTNLSLIDMIEQLSL